MSWAEVTWPGAGRPVTFKKFVSSMPSSAARWFILATKASSLPQTASARATAQSLAETTATALSISWTVSCSFSFSQIWLPPMEMAWREAVMFCSSVSFPASSASKTSSRVMTLVTLAGSSRAWELFS